MSDRLDPISDPSPEEVAAVEAVLARAGADGDLWAELPVDLEDQIVTTIDGEIVAATASRNPATSLDDAREARAGRRDLGVPWWLGAAAAIALVVTGIALVTRSGDDSGDGDGAGDDAIEFTLVGTAAAPDARADVVMSSTPAGMKILLDADGLPGAPDGAYYEAWLTDGDVSVSAGTFHLRGGSNQIELWAGVVGAQFDTLSVTVEPVDADNSSSGDVVMRGTVDG